MIALCLIDDVSLIVVMEFAQESSICPPAYCLNYLFRLREYFDTFEYVASLAYSLLYVSCHHPAIQIINSLDW